MNWKVQEVNRGSILGKSARQVDIKLINRLQIHSGITGRTMTLLKGRHEQETVVECAHCVAC